MEADVINYWILWKQMRTALIVATALAVTLSLGGCASGASETLTVAEKHHVQEVAAYDACYENFVQAHYLKATEAASIVLPEIRQACGTDPHTSTDTWDHWKPVNFKG
jgi:hypothetical protein